MSLMKQLRISAEISWHPMPFGDCRAKTCQDGSPGTTVYDHCRYAGAIARALVGYLPDSVRKLLPPGVELAVALHDVGKVSPGFQHKYFSELLKSKSPESFDIITTKGGETDHAVIGARSIEAMSTRERFLVSSAVVEAICAHHGFANGKVVMLDDGPWQDERDKLRKALESRFGMTLAAFPHEMASDLLAGLTCVSDWLASDEDYFPADAVPCADEELDAKASSVLRDAGFQKLNLLRGLSFENVFGFTPWPEQKAFVDAVTGAGVYVLEASMGCGKTEAALYAAYRLMERGINSGLYFALPTRLTSDRIHLRVEDFMSKISAGSTSVKLAHGTAWLRALGSDQVGKDRVPAWFSPSKRGLLYPYAVGTIDQALLAVMNVKHGFVRAFGLAGKVVVIDEVHSYDLYTGTLLDKLVARLREIGCTVLILSATLTRERLRVLVGGDAELPDAYPLVSGRRTGEARVLGSPVVSKMPAKRVWISWIETGTVGVVLRALEVAREGGNVLCIANTVSTAQEWYASIVSERSDGDKNIRVGLLHSRFPSFRREAIENEWMEALGKSGKRPQGTILVSTQIVEQSVDIDADFIITELAPIDMFLQRLGRLWRHARPTGRAVPEPAISIALRQSTGDLRKITEEELETCLFAGSGCVYAPFVLLRTLEVLQGRAYIRIPSEIRELLETVYRTVRDDEMDDCRRRLFEKMRKRQEKLGRLALTVISSVRSLPTRPDDEQRAGTRYGDRPTVPLLLVKNVDFGVGLCKCRMTLLDDTVVEVDEYSRDLDVTRKLYGNLVSVPLDSQLYDLKQDEGVRKMGRIFAQHFHPAEMPLICSVDGEGTNEGRASLVCQGECLVRLTYRDDLGVVRNQAESDSRSALRPSLCERTSLSEEFDYDFIEQGTDW